jgi:hypothetical protein
MSQKVFLEKTATIGNVTVHRDYSMGKFGVMASCEDPTGETPGWSTDIYEFDDRQTADSVFGLLVSVIVEMTPEFIAAKIQLIKESDQ